jgi:predicted ferric reductase
MAHPLLLALSASAISPRAASAALFPEFSAWSVWVGWGALAAMAVFLAPTFEFFGRMEYQRWKALHALSALAVVLALAHALALGSSGMWGGYGALALLAIFYRMVISRLTNRKSYVIARVDKIGSGVIELSLKPDGDLLKYTEGQFVYLTPLDLRLTCGRGQEHPYTLSSAPSEPVLRIVIKDLGDATHALQGVSAGSQVLIEGPYGGLFSCDGQENSQLWIAGGIGLTPFLGRARALDAKAPVDIHLIYCAQDTSRAHFLTELEDIAAKVSGFKISTHFFIQEGPLNAAFLRARCPDLTGRDIYVCGPPPLIESSRRDLRGQGVAASRIHTEEFTWL